MAQIKVFYEPEMELLTVFCEPNYQIYKLYKELAVLDLQAYGFSPDGDFLEKLFALDSNLLPSKLIATEQHGGAISGS